MNFIKHIFVGKADEAVHRQFIRFGKGEYRKRALLSIWKTKNIKVKGSFEFANDFVLFVAGLGNAVFNGTILSKEEIPGLQGIKKEGKIVYNVSNLTSSKVKEIAPLVYCFLLNADGNGIKLRIKGKLPKPGKGEGKIDEKFCQLEIDEKYYRAAREDFFWDLPDCKKATIEHTFIIKDIIMPKGEARPGLATLETDYAKIREMAKRKGRVVRIANVDGKETRKEAEFEA
ncbi:MAG TPA: hypothetical protein VJ142_03215 [Candidatus Nanoarchaeia archaeon]|nr:hypothetical protein [Candidatus Nanoarchaeia archaeon]